MAAYSYKEVMHRTDYQNAIGPAMEHIGYTIDDYDADAGYDGDGWIVAAFLIDQKDDEIRRLRDALQRIAVGDGFYGAQAFEYKEIARQALTTVQETTT